jgi:hypothetical protein
MTRPRFVAFRPSRTFTRFYLFAASLFAWVTFSDDWHAIVNDSTATTSLSVASGLVVAALVLTATHRRR